MFCSVFIYSRKYYTILWKLNKETKSVDIFRGTLCRAKRRNGGYNEKYKIKVDEYEYRLIINALNELRKDEIEKGKEVNFINEVMEKLLEKA